MPSLILRPWPEVIALYSEGHYSGDITVPDPSPNRLKLALKRQLNPDLHDPDKLAELSNSRMGRVSCRLGMTVPNLRILIRHPSPEQASSL